MCIDYCFVFIKQIKNSILCVNISSYYRHHFFFRFPLLTLSPVKQPFNHPLL